MYLMNSYWCKYDKYNEILAKPFPFLKVTSELGDLMYVAFYRLYEGAEKSDGLGGTSNCPICEKNVLLKVGLCNKLHSN